MLNTIDAIGPLIVLLFMAGVPLYILYVFLRLAWAVIRRLER